MQVIANVIERRTGPPRFDALQRGAIATLFQRLADLADLDGIDAGNQQIHDIAKRLLVGGKYAVLWMPAGLDQLARKAAIRFAPIRRQLFRFRPDVERQRLQRVAMHCRQRHLL